MKSTFPVTEEEVESIRLLFSEEEVEEKIKEVAKKIGDKYLSLLKKEGRNFRLVLVGVLNGAAWLTVDLASRIEKQFNKAGYFGFVEWDFLSISRYHKGMNPKKVRLLLDTKEPVSGAYVILVEDIIDTGATAYWVMRHLSASKPLGIELFALLDKTPGREKEVRIDYIGFRVDEPLWVLGKGLDYGGKFRAMGDISYVVFSK